MNDRGKFAQFIINQRQKPAGRLDITRFDLLQYDRKVAHGGGKYWISKR